MPRQKKRIESGAMSLRSARALSLGIGPSEVVYSLGNCSNQDGLMNFDVRQLPSQHRETRYPACCIQWQNPELHLTSRNVLDSLHIVANLSIAKPDAKPYRACSPPSKHLGSLGTIVNHVPPDPKEEFQSSLGTSMSSSGPRRSQGIPRLP